MHNYLLLLLQNCIWRRNRKRKAAEELQDSPLPKVVRQLTRWQRFEKVFAETEGMGNFLFGCNSILVYFVLLFVEEKAAKLLSNSQFNKVASKHYNSLSEADKLKLIENKVASKHYNSLSEADKVKLIKSVASDVELMKQDVFKKVRKIFCQIQDKVKWRNNNIQFLQTHVFIFILLVSGTGELSL